MIRFVSLLIASLASAAQAQGTITHVRGIGELKTTDATFAFTVQSRRLWIRAAQGTDHVVCAPELSNGTAWADSASAILTKPVSPPTDQRDTVALSGPDVAMGFCTLTISHFFTPTTSGYEIRAVQYQGPNVVDARVTLAEVNAFIAKMREGMTGLRELAGK